MSLAALLIPLIPSLVQSVLAIVNMIQAHPDTPDAAKAQLADVAARLKDAAARVAAIKILPGPAA